MIKIRSLFLCVVCMGMVITFSACDQPKPAVNQTPVQETQVIGIEVQPGADAVKTPPTPETTHTDQPTAAATVQAATPTLKTIAVEKWQDWPVIPAGVSERAREIYKTGITKGNNPQAFSKIGDCESITEWFLADFDKGTKYYTLGSYEDLQKTIDDYQGSFGRLGPAAKPGFTAASVMSVYWRDPSVCDKNEAPLACEYRIHKPSIAIILLGTNDISRPENFEKNMRKVLDFSIQQGVLPVLTTKADNLEGDNRINAEIVKLAAEYQIPLWNFWKAVQPLPAHGLQEDKNHLTYGPNTFDDADVMQKAWPVRNLTALQLLTMLDKNLNP
jgi:hypothetical protein